MRLSFLVYLLLFIPIMLFFIWSTNNRVFKDKPLYFKYAVVILLVLILWDELALQLRHWYYPAENNLGILIGKHPLEIIASGLLFPLLIISIWEFVKRRK